MAAAPPPWRVFDAPLDDPEVTSPDQAARMPQAAVQARAGAPAGSGTGGDIRSEPERPTSPGIRLRPDVLVGVAAALGGLAMAWLLATGGSIGGSGLDGGAGLSRGVSADGATRAIGSGDLRGLALPGGEVVIDVAGAVLRPGVYHLPAGSRIGDAIRAAGGFGPRVAADQAERQLNLAAVIHDGDRVVVPSRDDAGSAAAATPASSGHGGGLIDLNTASESELDTLPGIGPVTAGKIVASRAEQPFRAVNDLLTRKLVGQKTFDSIKALVTVG